MAEKGYTFKDNRPEVKARLDQFVEQALTMAGMTIEANINPLIPVDTTALLISLTYKVDMGKKEVAIGVNTAYAIYVEFGTGIHAERGGGRNTPWYYKKDDGTWVRTVGQRPQPYMRKGYENAKSDVEKLIRALFAKF